MSEIQVDRPRPSARRDDLGCHAAWPRSIGSRARSLLACLAVMAGVCPALAQQAVGGEFQVNTITVAGQGFPVVGFDQEGDFVVVWQTYVQPGVASDIFARRFGAGGTPQSPDLLVNSFTTGTQLGPAVAVDAAGGFVVVWMSYAQDGSHLGIFARRFDPFGAPLGVEFQVNSYTTGIQDLPAIARRSTGEFMVVWESVHDRSDDGVFARRFDAFGTALAVEFQVNVYTAGNQRRPAVALESDGDFVVVWDSIGQDGSGYGIFARRFNLFGSPVGGEFLVNSYTDGFQANAEIALDGDGDAVVVWQSTAQDGSQDGVFGRRFASSGQLLGVEFQVNQVTANHQRAPKLAMTGGGDFVVTWFSNFQDGSSYGVFARRFSAAGSPSGGEQQVNSYATGSQNFPSVAAGGGDYVIAWQSTEQDGSDTGVFAQRYAATISIDVDGDGAALPLTDGLLILRFLFGFTGNVLVNGVVNLAGCTRCTAPEIESFLDALF